MGFSQGSTGSKAVAAGGSNGSRLAAAMNATPVRNLLGSSAAKARAWNASMKARRASLGSNGTQAAPVIPASIVPTETSTTSILESTDTLEVITNNGRGTGSLVALSAIVQDNGGSLGYVATAYHVVEGAGSVSVRWPNGRSAKDCNVVVFDSDNDIAIVRVWVPAGIQPLAVASDMLGNPVAKIVGRHRETSGTVLRTYDEKLFIDAEVKPGDSGGAVIVDDQLVGVVSGGWLWVDPNTTWPTRAGSFRAVRNLMERIH